MPANLKHFHGQMSLSMHRHNGLGFSGISVLEQHCYRAETSLPNWLDHLDANRRPRQWLVRPQLLDSSGGCVSSRSSTGLTSIISTNGKIISLSKQWPHLLECCIAGV